MSLQWGGGDGEQRPLPLDMSSIFRGLVQFLPRGLPRPLQLPLKPSGVTYTWPLTGCPNALRCLLVEAGPLGQDDGDDDANL